MSIRAGLAVLAAAACMATPVMAQTPASAEEEADKPAIIITGRWPHDGACTDANTTAITFEDLLRQKDAYADKCVSTVAWINGRALFARREDAAAAGSNFTGDLSGSRMGLYGSEETMTKIWSTTSVRARVVGILWDCQDLNGPNVIMVMGYCHYTGGPIISVASFHPLQ
jgi:hypothetical protein